MAHKTGKSAYQRMAERLNRFPQGVVPSELLYKILRELMSENEASLVALLPIKPFSVATAAQCWKMDQLAARKILEELASRAILFDIETEDGGQLFLLPPPMIGFFEFSMMRVRGDVNQKVLAELFHQYVVAEDDFILNLIRHVETPFGRAFVNEPLLNEEILHRDSSLLVLDYERTSYVIESAPTIGVSMCYCRHVKMHLGEACDAPLDICLTFGTSAQSLIKHGYARQIEKAECYDLLDLAYDHNLVQFGENAQREIGFICNCCKCCCEAMHAARKFGILNPILTTNYIPEINDDQCNACGLCAAVCPVDALKVTADEEGRKHLTFDAQVCLGCGVCVRRCNREGIRLKQRTDRVISPVDTVHRTVLMAIERGTLQHLIFDNQAHLNHRAMAAILGVILKLPGGQTVYGQ